MKVEAIEAHQQTDVTMEGAHRVRMRMLIGPAEGAPNFHMRHFEIAPGGHSPHHQHPYEHEVMILSGRGFLKSEQGDRPFKAGDAVYVPADEKHQFVNDSDESCSFLCLIPAPQRCDL